MVSENPKQQSKAKKPTRKPKAVEVEITSENIVEDAKKTPKNTVASQSKSKASSSRKVDSQKSKKAPSEPLKTSTSQRPRLELRYVNEIRKMLVEDFNFSSPMQAPRFSKVVVNMGLGEALTNAKTAAFDAMGTAMLEGLEGLSIAGFSVLDLIGGNIDDPVECLALKKKRICEEIGRFKDNWQFYLLRKWMETVTSFFDAIGLGALTQYIGLDFCTFLGIIGFPTSIDLSFSDHIKEVPNKVVSALPAT